MARIGITGASGFIGWHFRCRLFGLKEVETIMLDDAAFNDPEAMRSFVVSCDAIVHLAGMNRGEEDAIYETNVRLTQTLIDACEAANVRPHILFASSTHRTRETAYGRSKKESEVRLRAWSERAGSSVTVMIFPNVFGEHGRPHYNSAVATFCDQIYKHEPSEINREGMIELVHVQEVAAHIVRFILERQTGEVRIQGTEINVGELYDLLSSMMREYESGIVPRLDRPLRTALFNTLRSFLPSDWAPKYPEKKTDERGWLFEAIKSENGGQTFISKTNPGITRGNHFHLRKVERFCVISGSAEIKLRRLFTDEIRVYRVDGEKPCWIDMPTLWTHNISNIGSSELITAFWSNEIFNPSDPDTFAHPV